MELGRSIWLTLHQFPWYRPPISRIEEIPIIWSQTNIWNIPVDVDIVAQVSSIASENQHLQTKKQ